MICLWCSSLRDHLLCAHCRPTKPQWGRSIFPFPLKLFVLKLKFDRDIVFVCPQIGTHTIYGNYIHVWSPNLIISIIFLSAWQVLKILFQKVEHTEMDQFIVAIWLGLGLRYAMSKINFQLNKIGGCAKVVSKLHLMVTGNTCQIWWIATPPMQWSHLIQLHTV